MSQHDFIIDDAPGGTFLADLNAALPAFATLSSGATAPATTYSYQFWADTTTNVLRRRNAANSAWLAVRSLDETTVLSRAANTILVSSDAAKAIIATAAFTQTLTAAATLADGWFVDLNAQGFSVVIDPNGAELIDGAATKTVTGSGRIYCNGSGFFTIGFPALTATTVCASVRQTVSGGPTDSAGLPNLGAASGAGTQSTSNVSASAPLALTSAAGFDAATGKALDYFGFSTANLTWTTATNGTMYLFADINTSTGALTPGTTVLAPVYQQGGTYSVVNLQNTYNIQEGVMKVGNGSTAAVVNRVFVGEVTVAGGVVTAVIWYAYQGRYDGAYTATLPAAATAVSRSHNIGIAEPACEILLKCTTTDAGYAVNDVIDNPGCFSNANYFTPAAIVRTALTLGTTTGSSGGLTAQHKTTGANTTLTAANWSYKFIAKRGW